jgi:hypothetical protein
MGERMKIGVKIQLTNERVLVPDGSCMKGRTCQKPLPIWHDPRESRSASNLQKPRKNIYFE